MTKRSDYDKLVNFIGIMACLLCVLIVATATIWGFNLTRQLERIEQKLPTPTTTSVGK